MILSPVSVPCRGTTFLNKSLRIKKLASLLFPSPVGELHFSMHKNLLKKWNKMVSVPCRGTTFLNCFYIDYLVVLDLFPSPVGELHFSIWIRTWNIIITGFPSPVGELHFSIKHLFQTLQLIVSVPCRGTTFLNWRSVQKRIRSCRFRPLSGNYISQWCWYQLEK